MRLRAGDRLSRTQHRQGLHAQVHAHSLPRTRSGGAGLRHRLYVLRLDQDRGEPGLGLARHRHPLRHAGLTDECALIRAWRERPQPVEPDRRADKRILPTIKVIETRPERRAGMLFGGVHDGRRVTDVALELPLWPDTPAAKRVPLLDIVDLAGVPVMAKGRGAPLPNRLFLRALASIAPEDRRREIARLALTVREFRNGLFPRGWERRRDWPRLRHALLHVRDYAIHDGRGRWFPLSLRYLPDEPALDDIIVLDVAYPPQSYSGAPVDLPEMDALSVESAPRWRAYIGAHSVVWIPGRTRVPHPQSGQYVWATDPDAYPVLTIDDRRRLAFGLDLVNKQHRSHREINDKFRDLPGLAVLTEQAVDPRSGEVGWRVMPTDAARAVQQGANRRE